jgi:hypothetical protein
MSIRRRSIIGVCPSAKVRPSLNGLPKEKDWETNQYKHLHEHLNIRTIEQILRCSCDECGSDTRDGDTKKLAKQISDRALSAFAVCIVAGQPKAINHLDKCTDGLFPIWCDDGTLRRKLYRLTNTAVDEILSKRSTFFSLSLVEAPPSPINFAEGERRKFYDDLRGQLDVDVEGSEGIGDPYKALARWTHHLAENGNAQDFEWMGQSCFPDNHDGLISDDARLVWSLGNVLLDVLEFIFGGPANVKKLDQARSDSTSAQQWISNNERRFRYDGRCENRARSRRLCFGFHLARDMLDPLPSRRPDRSRVHGRVAELVRPNRDENYHIASPDDSYRLVKSMDKFRFM